MFPRTRYQRFVNLNKKDAALRLERSAEFENPRVVSGWGALYSREKSTATFRQKKGDDYYRLSDSLLVAAHVRFFSVDESKTRMDIKFDYVTTPLSVVAALTTVLLTMALFFVLSLVIPLLDAIGDDYIPYFRDYGVFFIIALGIVSFVATVKTAFLFWSVRDIMKAISRTYRLGENGTLST